MGNLFSRLLAAAPDLFTACVYLTAWISPAVLGPVYVNALVMGMLMAAFTIIAGGAYAQMLKSHSRVSGAFTLLAMGAVSLLIIIQVLNESDPSTDHTLPSRIDLWPLHPAQLIPFVWLYASQFLHLITHPAHDDSEGSRMETLSTFSIAAYVCSFLAAIALPLSALGLTPEFIAGMQRGEGDMWGAHLNMPIAFGAFYFGLQMLLKFALTGAPAARAGAPVAAASGQQR